MNMLFSYYRIFFGDKLRIQLIFYEPPRFCSDGFLKILHAVNRRLDEWVKLDQLDLDTVEADIDEKVEDKVFV